MSLRYSDGRYRFDEEKAAESPLYVQRLLTELGRRVELFTDGVENNVRKFGHYKYYPRKKVELFEDRMKRLTGVARLCVRNGFDLAGILHLIDHSKFNT